MRVHTLLVAVLAAPAILAAQRPTYTGGAGPRLGVMAGINSSTFGGDDAGNPDHRTGFIGGVYVTVPVGSPAVALRPELLFSQKGATSTLDGVTAGVDLNYLEIPVLLQVTLPGGGGVRPRVYAGPSVAFQIGCRVDVVGYNTPNGSLNGGSTYSTGCSDAAYGTDLGVKSVDVGAVAGGQVNFEAAGRAVGVGVRYTYGFSDVSQYAHLQNRVLSAYVSLELSPRRGGRRHGFGRGRRRR